MNRAFEHNIYDSDPPNINRNRQKRNLQLMTTPHGSIRLQIILCRQVRSIALGQSAYGAAEEISIVVDYVTDIHNHIILLYFPTDYYL